MRSEGEQPQPLLSTLAQHLIPTEASIGRMATIAVSDALVALMVWQISHNISNFDDDGGIKTAKLFGLCAVMIWPISLSIFLRLVSGEDSDGS